MQRRSVLICALAGLLAGCVACSAHPQPAPASDGIDVILRGQFITLDPSHERANAVAVSKRRIVAVGSVAEGSESELEQWARERASQRAGAGRLPASALACCFLPVGHGSQADGDPAEAKLACAAASQSTNGCETAYSNPMMRLLRPVSTTSLVTIVNWLAVSTRSTCFISRSIKRMFPWVMRIRAATAS